MRTSATRRSGEGTSGWWIRPAVPGDGAALAEVLTAAGVRAWGAFLGAERIRTATAGARHPADLIAEDAEGVFGFVAWDGQTGEITRLYLHPRAWGGGAASALLERALEALSAAGRAQAWLNTEERNARARRFYEREGWRVEGSPRVRDWHGVVLCETRYVRDL
jgi:ribosomal protein S18 acetylase RimI-like enzyme